MKFHLTIYRIGIYPIFPLVSKQIPAFLGCILLFVGLFSPMFSMPFIGNFEFWNKGGTEGWLFLLVSIWASVLSFAKKISSLWVPAIFALILIIVFFSRVYQQAKKFQQLGSLFEQRSSQVNIHDASVNFHLENGCLYLLGAILVLFTWSLLYKRFSASLY